MLLVALFATSGLFHFLTPSPFVDIVPRMLPRPGLLVAVSGAAELLGAGGLLLRRTRRAAGWALILLLIAVFPSNIKMLADARASASSAWSQALLWMRLPLQPLLIWIVWQVAVKLDAGRLVEQRNTLNPHPDSVE